MWRALCRPLWPRARSVGAADLVVPFSVHLPAQHQVPGGPLYNTRWFKLEHQTLSCISHTNMKVLSVILLAVVLFLGMVAARPNDILNVDIPNLSHEQEGIPGQAVHGEYEALDAFGNWYKVEYVADEKGFRIV
ncbi:uncharacterized protein LOC123506268 [Portunus trituberculatus]|uniref:uncharacterized protein LOC123506268 n=1 Tax=Portunus trituberculatus TaxID=210409 RepID=UPI001E1CD1C0|nr:uncharacterized protein LOC123506268 [Portunus trituberculatus]